MCTGEVSVVFVAKINKKMKKEAVGGEQCDATTPHTVNITGGLGDHWGP